jgi:hypothetical protein
MVAIEGANGEQFALSSDGGTGQIFLRRGPKGLDMIPWDVQVDEYPALDGEVIRAVRGQSREIFLPLTVWGTTRPQMVAAKRRLIKALNPARMSARMPKLVVSEFTDAGTYEDQREIEVYYAGGLDGDEGSDNGLTWNSFGLVLRSTSPFFSARTDTTSSFYVYPELNPFFPGGGTQPFVSADGLTGGMQLVGKPSFVTAITVSNPGDVSSYPTWQIEGPISAPFQLVRAQTDYSPAQSLDVVSLTLTAGQTWTLNTEPGKLRSVSGAGTSVGWSALATNPQFWALDPGPNDITINGLAPGVTPLALGFTFRAKYLGM